MASIVVVSNIVDQLQYNKVLGFYIQLHADVR